MGFFRPEYYTKQQDHAFHYRSGCFACPLKNEHGGNIEPTGSKTPIVYILGEAPGYEEVRDQAQFVGRSGQQLRKFIPKEWLPKLRWNNCVRSRPPENRDPTEIELASCRRSVEQDIEVSKPRAIFGFGGVPLKWALDRTGITVWTGRYVPIRVGKHTCWFFPMMHPSYILRSAGKEAPPYLGDYTSDLEFTFDRHLKQAFRLVQELPEPIVHTVDNAFKGVDFDMRCTDSSVERIRKFVDNLYNDDVVGVDLETNALRPYNASSKILTVALSGSKGTLAWPMYHRQARWSQQQLGQLEQILENFIRKSRCRKAVHQLAFEQEWFAVLYGVDCLRASPGGWGCSLGQAFILDPRMLKQAGGGPLSLAFLTLQHFGLDVKTLAQLDRANLDNTDLDSVLRYNASDARYHRLLYIRQAQLITHNGLDKVYQEHLRRLTTAVLTQVKGVPVNTAATEKLSVKYNGLSKKALIALNKLEVIKKFREVKGQDYNPLSPAHVRFCIQNLLPSEISDAARDRDGEFSSMDEHTLNRVKHPIASKTLDCKKIAKVIGTYIEPYRAHLFEDGCAHPQTMVSATRTWRTSAADLNYQNQPKRDEGRREVRAQVAKPGHKVVSFDYAQIQARNIAMESLDASLIKAFKERYDIHSDWVERIARAYPAWIKEGVKKLATDKKLFKSYRNKVKSEFVFASFFGAKPQTVAYHIGCDNSLGERFHEQLWGEFPDILKWHKRLERMYFKHGYVTGHSGFRRPGPLTHNELINAPIQADEAMIVLDAMTRLSEMGWPYQANMEIHDDLTFVWPTKTVDQRMHDVLNVMMTVPYEWAQVVPIGVEVSVGDDWHKQEQVGEFFSDTWGS